MVQNFLTTVLSKLAVKRTIEDYEKIQRENPGRIKVPSFLFWIGMISMVFWGAMMILVLFFAKDAVTVMICAIVFGVLFLLGLFLVLYEKNYKVVYKDGMIIYRNIFRMTRTYICDDIEHAYYKDSGGIRFVFKNGKKLNFAKEEQVFYEEVIKKEHLKCTFKGEEKAIIKVYFHPFFMCPCWIVGAGMLLCTFWLPEIFLFAILVLLFCLGCQLSNTTYDKEQKILTRTICGLSKKYDMKNCSAKPVYENGYLMKIEIYEKDKRVTKVPVSVEYKNRARLIRAICRISV